MHLPFFLFFQFLLIIIGQTFQLGQVSVNLASIQPFLYSCINLLLEVSTKLYETHHSFQSQLLYIQNQALRTLIIFLFSSISNFFLDTIKAASNAHSRVKDRANKSPYISVIHSSTCSRSSLFLLMISRNFFISSSL